LEEKQPVSRGSLFWIPFFFLPSGEGFIIYSFSHPHPGNLRAVFSLPLNASARGPEVFENHGFPTKDSGNNGRRNHHPWVGSVTSLVCHSWMFLSGI